MNRILMAGASTVLAASVLAGGLALAAPAGAATSRAAASMFTAASCRAAHTNIPFPSRATTYAAGAAGSVTVAPVNKGTIKVTAVHPSPGYRAFVDSSRGSSVDVYFRGHSRHLKFEAEINDTGGLTVTVTTCRP